MVRFHVPMPLGDREVNSLFPMLLCSLILFIYVYGDTCMELTAVWSWLIRFFGPLQELLWDWRRPWSSQAYSDGGCLQISLREGPWSGVWVCDSGQMYYSMSAFTIYVECSVSYLDASFFASVSSHNAHTCSCTFRNVLKGNERMKE